MVNLHKGHIAAALTLALIVGTASLVAFSLTFLEWPFASASPFSPNPFGGPRPAEGFLLINASHYSNGVEEPISGATITIVAKQDNHLLKSNTTDVYGITSYAIPEGSYSINLESKYGSASDSVRIVGGHTTIVNYVSINQTEVAISFDIMTEQPNIVAPWDTVYVKLPNLFYGLNLSAVDTFIEPIYLNSGNSSGPSRSFGIPYFPVTAVQIPAKIVSEEILPSETSFWLQLRPIGVFSTSDLSALKILQYNSTLIVSLENNTIQAK